MQIRLIPGDNLWNHEGQHVCGVDGVVPYVQEEIFLEVTEEVAALMLPILVNERALRGLDENGNPFPEETPE